MSVSTVVLPLVGVALGSLSTLIGQYLSTRVDVRRAKHEEASAERAERKEAIMDFLSAAQQAELLLDRFASGQQRDEPEIYDRLHALWLAKKVPELVCSPAVAQAAHDYALALHKLLREQPMPAGPTKREFRFAFLEAARKEFAIASEPLRRDSPTGIISQGS